MVTFSSNAFTSHMALRAMIADWSARDLDLFRLAEDKLASYNKVMAARRIQSRTAPVNSFHRYFHRIVERKHMVKYLTTSFDGLEVTKKHAAVDDNIVRMHGDNRFLRCCTSGCPGLKVEGNSGLEHSLISGATLSCIECTQSGESSVLRVLMALLYLVRLCFKGHELTL